MSTAHLIHGFLGVGKTTFARELEVELGAVRFSEDEWMVELYGHDPPVELFAAHSRSVRRVMERQWIRCLALALDVVLDFGFWRRDERDGIRSQLASLGSHCTLYRLTCPEAQSWRRIEARNSSLGDSLLITRNTFEVLRGRFEPLADDEERVEIRSRPTDDP
jgi:predicted kinase